MRIELKLNEVAEILSKHFKTSVKYIWIEEKEEKWVAENNGHKIKEFSKPYTCIIIDTKVEE